MNLRTQEALQLFQQGKSIWNQWVEDNPDASILIDDDQPIKWNNFEGYKFPKGGINCIRAWFTQEVSFKGAEFLGGIVNFNGASFEKGCDFSYAKFNNTEVDFSRTFFRGENCFFKGVKFCSGENSFQSAHFESSKTIFDEAELEQGTLNFRNSEFNGYNNTASATFKELTINDSNLDFGGAKFINVVADYTQCSSSVGGLINFDSVDCSNGEISFFKAELNDIDISFEKAIFRSMEFSFDFAIVGKSESVINFDGVIFQNTNTTFYETKFKGKATFNEAKFLNESVSFLGAEFSKGAIFEGADFGNSKASFVRAKFFGNRASFNNSVFCGESIAFCSAEFHTDVFFHGIEYKDGRKDFTNCKFLGGLTVFANTDFGKGITTFNHALFEKTETRFGWANFDEVIFSDITIQESNCFSLQYAAVEKSIDLSGSKFSCVVDIRNINNKNIDLDRTECEINRGKGIRALNPFKKCIDEDDIPRSRRLKEIAEANKDHDRALHFHALEMRAKRWKTRGRRASILDLLFSFSCDYGQNIVMPFLLLLLSTITFTAVYDYLSGNVNHFWSHLLFSASNSIPLLPVSKVINKQELELLLTQSSTHSIVYVVMGIQNFIAIVLIFLIGLGLRNRFRI